MDDITQKFLDRLKDLVALGKKKKSILDVQEINDFFNDLPGRFIVCPRIP